jgi:hypothetical protein
MSGAQGAMLRNNIHFQAKACRTIGRVGSKHNDASPGAYHGTVRQHNAIPLHEVQKPILVLELFCDLLGLVFKFVSDTSLGSYASFSATSLGSSVVSKLSRYLIGLVFKILPLPHS